MIDQIYILHHPSLVERKQYLEKRIQEENIKNIKWMDELYSESTFKDIKSNLPPKSVEVSYRHFKCLEDILQNHDFGLILEDDVILTLKNNYPINDFLAKVVEEMKQQNAIISFPGIVYCEGFHGLPDTFDFNPLIYHKPGFNTRCCHAYIVSKEGARILIKHFNYFNPVDIMYNELMLRHNIISYYTKFGFHQGTVIGTYPSAIR